jgi:hypothetical protein
VTALAFDGGVVREHGGVPGAVLASTEVSPGLLVGGSGFLAVLPEAGLRGTRVTLLGGVGG